ncbi:hypothetical protein PoB_000639500 [Plakobranchus ocellatus]|uniref:Uncharacterized protein n=1 Tax=Plakobranchus ocellatus TaxID=259542 RepID=A0AAV3YAT5_9GAST|nr:hypothetical protein PoB_000639500 [Plakobranchus ocellatus]
MSTVCPTSILNCMQCRLIRQQGHEWPGEPCVDSRPMMRSEIDAHAPNECRERRKEAIYGILSWSVFGFLYTFDFAESLDT